MDVYHTYTRTRHAHTQSAHTHLVVVVRIEDGDDTHDEWVHGKFGNGEELVGADSARIILVQSFEPLV